jgi:hypothetical protein
MGCDVMHNAIVAVLLLQCTVAVQLPQCNMQPYRTDKMRYSIY